MAYCLLLSAFSFFVSRGQGELKRREIQLPSSKALLFPAPGQPQSTNSFPTTVALSPDGRFLAILNNGYGTEESGYQQSIAVLDLNTNRLSDYPDSRLAKKARQTYFLGLAFSADGKRLYASIASLTDPEGKGPGDTGNGIAVYGFEEGHPVAPGFVKIPLPSLGPGRASSRVGAVPAGKAIPYPAGLAVVRTREGEKLLVADDLSDDALLLDANTGKIISRFDLSTQADVPAAYPYGVVATRDGRRGYCSLWNASKVAELDLRTGRVVRMIPLLEPTRPTAAGSHPTALLLSPDEKYLYVALANRDRVAVIETATGEPVLFLPTELPDQQEHGSFPNALAQSTDGKRLFVADASADAVAVFDTTFIETGNPGSLTPPRALGFIPTEWYPTALAVHGDDLLIAAGKGKGTGPNSAMTASSGDGPRGGHPYIASLIHGSIAQVSIRTAEGLLAKLTDEVKESNRMHRKAEPIQFTAGRNPIRHVIYIIKENRSYDQVFGDLKSGNGDPSLCLYGEDITPNQHELARQFGILDNFYCSGEVSGDGHVWSTAAITSDYTEKTWEIGYRGSERLYDYEGEVSHRYPLEEDQPDVNEPATGYIWTNVARHALSHRNYGEFVATEWCNEFQAPESPQAGTPSRQGLPCPRTFVLQGELLPAYVGQPHGSRSPWPWAIPLIARDVPTKPELHDQFDPRFPDFNLQYPDQLRVDEFLNEFEEFARARQTGRGSELPQFVILRLGDDHTAGTRPGSPSPEASIADNDLAVGRVIDAISHSPYWDDTGVFILEDDAQDGPDHVDAHRSIAFVISKYAPGSTDHPFVDDHFYTTVDMVRTMEVLLGLPPMNNNDAWAAVMAPLFTGPGNQPPFTADYRNRDNSMIYRMNPPNAPGAKESARMDFSHADAVDPTRLNAILWRDRKGNLPMPAPRHRAICHKDD